MKVEKANPLPTGAGSAEISRENSISMTRKGQGKVLLVLGDPFSERIFFSSGIVSRLHRALGRRFQAVTINQKFDNRRWTGKTGIPDPVVEQSLLASRKPSLWQRVHARIDQYLDARIGAYPLGLRFNMRHGFHIERMRPGHSNWFLDSDRIGPLPEWDILYRMMFWWLFSRLRYVEPGIMRLLREGVDILLLSNLQRPTMYRYLVAAQRFNVPVLGYVSSWDHLVGKGVVYPYGQRYIVQNDQMKNEIVRLHGIEAERVTVTGWPQTDVFAQPRLRRDFDTLLESFGLPVDHRSCVLVTGNTKTNAPYEPRFLERLVKWWRDTGADQRFNLIFRPHPKDIDWRERFVSVADTPNFYIQPPSYTDMDVLALMLKHVDCVVTNAGTVLLDSLINDRPVVCVLYDEDAPEDEQHARKNVLGEHYRDLMESGAFYRAESFDEVTWAIERSLVQPDEQTVPRRKVVKKVVGVVDGQAAERVAQAFLNEIQAINQNKEE